MFGFLRNIGPTEIIVIALILIILFGSKLVTKLAKTGGESVKELKNAKKTFTEALKDDEEVGKAKKGAA